MTKTYKPHPDFQSLDETERKRWADALRSGEYEQCKGTLLNNAGHYCCIGVFQAINDKPTEGNEARYRQLEDQARINNKLPEEVFLGWDPDGNEFNPMQANDDYSLTFPQIADLIEGKEVVIDD